MRELLLWSMAFFATWVAICVLAVVILRWRLQRANRVSPAVKSPAPVSWLWMPTTPARHHRRLQVAAREIHLAPSRTTRDSPSLSVDDLRRQLESQCVELDFHLVAAARHPRRPRRALLVQLNDQITEVEALSIRLSRLARPDDVPTSGWNERSSTPEVLDRISEQLDLLDEAQRELTDIERAAGLVDVDHVFEAVRTPIAHQLPAPPSRRR